MIECVRPGYHGKTSEANTKSSPASSSLAFAIKCWRSSLPLKDVPEVIVTIGDRDRLTSALAESITKVKKVAESKQAYKDAYRGHRGWFKAIAPYFEEDDEDEEAE